jgi:hypothetical protein
MAAKALRRGKGGRVQARTGGMNYIDLPRMAYYVDKATYRNAVTSRITALKGGGK